MKLVRAGRNLVLLWYIGPWARFRQRLERALKPTLLAYSPEETMLGVADGAIGDDAREFLSWQGVKRSRQVVQRSWSYAIGGNLGLNMPLFGISSHTSPPYTTQELGFPYNGLEHHLTTLCCKALILSPPAMGYMGSKNRRKQRLEFDSDGSGTEGIFQKCDESCGVDEVVLFSESALWK
jgi:hypothetical protein